MPYIQITHEYVASGETCFNIYDYYNASPVPTAAMVSDLLGQFEANVLPAINDLQSDEVDNVQLIGYAPNLLFSQSVAYVLLVRVLSLD